GREAGGAERGADPMNARRSRRGRGLAPVAPGAAGGEQLEHVGVRAAGGVGGGYAGRGRSALLEVRDRAARVAHFGERRADVEERVRGARVPERRGEVPERGQTVAARPAVDAGRATQRV